MIRPESLREALKSVEFIGRTGDLKDVDLELGFSTIFSVIFPTIFSLVFSVIFKPDSNSDFKLETVVDCIFRIFSELDKSVFVNLSIVEALIFEVPIFELPIFKTIDFSNNDFANELFNIFGFLFKIVNCSISSDFISRMFILSANRAGTLKGLINKLLPSGFSLFLFKSCTVSIF